MHRACQLVCNLKKRDIGKRTQSSNNKTATTFKTVWLHLQSSREVVIIIIIILDLVYLLASSQMNACTLCTTSSCSCTAVGGNKIHPFLCDSLSLFVWTRRFKNKLRNSYIHVECTCNVGILATTSYVTVVVLSLFAPFYSVE